MKLYYIQPSKFRLDGGAMYGIIPKPLWEKNSPPDKQNRIDLALRLVLIKDGDKNILIDTGIGDYHSNKFKDSFDIRTTSSPIEDALKDVELTPGDITDVVISHLHFDHAGGLLTLENGEPISKFPNSTLHIHRKHYEYSLNPNSRDAGSFQSYNYKKIIELHEKDNKVNWLNENAGEILKLTDGPLRFICSHGHTPHMIHPFNDKFIYLTDIVPTSNHIKTVWVMGYDMNPGTSTDNKTRLLSLVAERKLLAIYEHDPLFFGSFVEIDEKGNYKAKEKQPAAEGCGTFQIDL